MGEICSAHDPERVTAVTIVQVKKLELREVTQPRQLLSRTSATVFSWAGLVSICLPDIQGWKVERH